MGENKIYSPDQPIVKGADVIYPPKGQAGEYAPLPADYPNPLRVPQHH